MQRVYITLSNCFLRRGSKVRDSNADTKFQKDSGFSVVLAYENAIKSREAKGELPTLKVLTSTQRDEAQVLEPQGDP